MAKKNLSDERQLPFLPAFVFSLPAAFLVFLGGSCKSKEVWDAALLSLASHAFPWPHVFARHLFLRFAVLSATTRAAATSRVLIFGRLVGILPEGRHGGGHCLRFLQEQPPPLQDFVVGQGKLSQCLREWKVWEVRNGCSFWDGPKDEEIELVFMVQKKTLTRPPQPDVWLRSLRSDCWAARGKPEYDSASVPDEEERRCIPAIVAKWLRAETRSVHASHTLAKNAAPASPIELNARLSDKRFLLADEVLERAKPIRRAPSSPIWLHRRDRWVRLRQGRENTARVKNVNAATAKRWSFFWHSRQVCRDHFVVDLVRQGVGFYCQSSATEQGQKVSKVIIKSFDICSNYRNLLEIVRQVYKHTYIFYRPDGGSNTWSSPFGH